MLVKLILCLVGKAVSQVSVKKSYYLNNEILLLVIDRWWIDRHKSRSISLRFSLGLILQVLIGSILFSLHQIINRDQLENYEVGFAVLNLFVYFPVFKWQFNAFSVLLDERAEILHWNIRLHCRIEVFNRQSTNHTQILSFFALM